MSSTLPVVVQPAGRLDTLGARALESELHDWLSRGETHSLVDFSTTPYIGSHGLRVLLRACQAAHRHGGAVKFCCANARVVEIIEMTGFDEVFELYDTRAAGEQAFE